MTSLFDFAKNPQEPQGPTKFLTVLVGAWLKKWVVGKDPGFMEIEKQAVSRRAVAERVRDFRESWF